jgi:hypothetical protein
MNRDIETIIGYVTERYLTTYFAVDAEDIASGTGLSVWTVKQALRVATGDELDIIKTPYRPDRWQPSRPRLADLVNHLRGELILIKTPEGSAQ